MRVRGNRFILKGDVIFSRTPRELEIHEGAYLVCKGGICGGVFDHKEEIPESFRSFPIYDLGDDMIIPGMTDLHLHGAQYVFRGCGMDFELLDWLDHCTFPEEERFADEEYASRAYGQFVQKLKKSGTTRAVIFGTLHVRSTMVLMDLLEESGLITYAGKVSMDRNSPEGLSEKDPQAALEAVREWLALAAERGYKRTYPILTPRFTPSCSDQLMKGLGELKREFDLPLQSHLSENPSEVELVKSLCPGSSCYGDTYRRYGLFGGEGKPVIMAHAVYSAEEEIRMMKEGGVYIAHCPQSNMNLSSGIAPVRRYLDQGLRMGLGTDLAAGADISMFRAVTDAVGASKLRWRYVDQSAKPLSFAEAFYLATRGGGSFFGKVGAFEEGFDFDALILREKEKCVRKMETRYRLEQFFSLYGENGLIAEKFVRGRKISIR